MFGSLLNLTQDCRGWDHLPTEIKFIIFNKLNIKSLINCFYVNKNFWDIADYTAQHAGLWQEIVENRMINRGISFVIKSKLHWREIFINSLLWFHIDKADISLLQSYKIAFHNYDKVNVYRDNLIVVTYNKGVKYYNVDNFKMTKELPGEYSYFEENDHMIAVVMKNLPVKGITLFGKNSPDDFNLDDRKSTYWDQIRQFKLDGNCCYVIVEKNVVLVFKWHNSEWKNNLVARYYGGDDLDVAYMHVFDRKLYILIQWGLVMEADMELHQFNRVLALPSSNYPCTLMFRRCSAVFEMEAVRPYPKDYQLNTDASPLFMTRSGDDLPSALVLECPNLSCATDHGDVLFLGYNDGKVKIIPNNWETWKRPYQQRVLRDINVMDLDSNVTHPRILQLNVYEAERAHHLFIATHSHLFQVLISYTDSDKLIWKTLSDGYIENPN